MNKIKKILWFLGLHAFSIILVLILLGLILGGLLFYKYVILIKKEEPKIAESSYIFKEKNYQKVLEEWQAREQKFEELLPENYPNPFKENISELKQK